MGLKPKHRREIRDLLRILYDDKHWQNHHTDKLLSIVRATRSDVADEVEITVTQDLADQKRANLAIRRDLVEAVRDVDKFRDKMAEQHAKIGLVLEALVDLPLAKAMVGGEVDVAAINDKDAKIALSAMDKILKISGAYARKEDAATTTDNAFELLDAFEVEETT